MSLIKNPTQCEKILKVLIESKGEWVEGNHFSRTMFLSQTHARIWELRNLRDKHIYHGEIETSDFRNKIGFVSYRLVD